MSNFNSYLKEEMGLSITTHEWEGASHLPLYLAKAARYHLCICNGVDFIAAEIERGSSLPELKRISVHISDRASLPVVLVAQIDARQRKALVSQGIPFVVPGRQAFLPMLGFIANARRDLSPLSKVMAPSTQAALVALMANPDLRTSEKLREMTGMPSSSVSRALDDLSRRGLINKSKQARQVIIECNGSQNQLIKRAKDCLQNPVARVTYTRRSKDTDFLPLAGESALSERSLLTPPIIECRALLKKTFKANKFEEIQLGELPNEETIRLQIWTYDPLVAGRGEIDDVSLALTLIDTEDERVIGQLNALFKEELW